MFSGAYETTNAVTVTVGGVGADVLWAGLVGAGLYQINVRVPASLADGDQAVVAMVAGLSTQSGALVKVAASAKIAAVKTRRRRPDHMLFLAAIAGDAKRPVSGGELARLTLQALERQGGLIQL